ncbi:hypothetical protein HDU76_011692 [Blyttiomyces sp. JEL0837]|nr:hypothetical protein HDU76_011692 [Blyttiomyces sp. JEL0837]
MFGPFTYVNERFEDETPLDLNPGLSYDDFSKSIIERMDIAHAFAREFAEKDQQERQDSDTSRSAFEFEVGDYAWLSAPLRTRHTTQGVLSEKLQYRWIGPVRIVKIHGTDSKSQIDVVETYPGYEIVRRTVHVSRLRLYTYLEPEDNAEYAARIAQPDIEAELDLWKNN